MARGWSAGGPGGIVRTGSAEYLSLILDHRARTHIRIPTLYAQTSILAHPRLRLNAGLRWEQQRFSSPTTGSSSAIDPQLEPRLGVIVYPSGSPDQKFVASLGRFYEQVPSQPVTWHWGGLRQRFFFYTHDPQVDASGANPSFWDDVPSRELRGQYYHEATIGYERTVARATSLSVHASHRALREVIGEVARSPVEHTLGNPGRGEFATLPRPNNRYNALEVMLSRLADRDNGYMVSYVLSRKTEGFTEACETRRLGIPTLTP